MLTTQVKKGWPHELQNKIDLDGKKRANTKYTEVRKRSNFYWLYLPPHPPPPFLQGSFWESSCHPPPKGVEQGMLHTIEQMTSPTKITCLIYREVAYCKLSVTMQLFLGKKSSYFFIFMSNKEVNSNHVVTFSSWLRQPLTVFWRHSFSKNPWKNVNTGSVFS